MDLARFFDSLGAFDIVALLIVAFGFVSGFVQGPIRRLLGIGIAIFILALALNLRAPVGGWLATYWTQDSLEYAELIAAGAAFAILYVTTMLAAQVYVKPMTIFPGRPQLNEILGGVLGVVEVVIVMGAVILIMDSYFRSFSISTSPNEFGFLRALFRFYDDSLTAQIYREWLIPGFLLLFGWLLPASVRAIFTH